MTIQNLQKIIGGTCQDNPTSLYTSAKRPFIHACYIMNIHLHPSTLELKDLPQIFKNNWTCSQDRDFFGDFESMTNLSICFCGRYVTLSKNLNVVTSKYDRNKTKQNN